MPDGDAVILPQNFADFGRDLEIPHDQLALYIATRELAHARLFRHARWLRLHVLSSVREYAEGIRIDVGRLEELAESFDPTNPDELREALKSGALIPPKTPEQVEAKLERRVPTPFRLHAHHWLILHGRYTCKARLPECWRCPVVDLCAYKAKVLVPPKVR